jgi:glycosidase
MLAALFQMTYPGIPQVYYGDEIGLEGKGDPDCRRTFPWGSEKKGSGRRIHGAYKKLIALRHRYAALRTGAFRTVWTEGKGYAYLREDGKDRIVVVLNNETQAKKASLPLGKYGFADGTGFGNPLDQSRAVVVRGEMHLLLAPLSGAVMVKEK